MHQLGDYFFCGIGGSGMTPLALIIQARGVRVEGSDRALDQGRNVERFDFLRAQGVLLHPQDGSGIRRHCQILVTSAAVKESVPDVQAARPIERRGRKAFAFPDRSACGDAIVRLARRSDRIVIMGARDESLSQFARELIRRIDPS